MEEEQLPIEVREESFRISDSGMVTGEIWLETDGLSFPEAHWDDFVVVILTWWLEAFGVLSRPGVASVFRFMDGPYEFHVAKEDGENLTVSCAEGRGRKVVHVRQLNTRLFKRGLLRAAKLALSFCDAQRVTTKDVELLRKEIRALERA